MKRKRSVGEKSSNNNSNNDNVNDNNDNNNKIKLINRNIFIDIKHVTNKFHYFCTKKSAALGL